MNALDGVWWCVVGWLTLVLQVRRKKTTSNNVGALIHTSALHYTKVLSLLLYSSTFYIQSLKAKTKLRESLFTTFDSYCIWYQTYWLTYDWWGHSMNTSLYCKWLRKSGWGFSHERGLLFPISFDILHKQRVFCMINHFQYILMYLTTEIILII